MPQNKQAQKKPSPQTYKGGITRYDKHGYILEHAPWHPNATTKEKMVAQHRLVAEDGIGRLLLREEDVHHRDFDPANNSPKNLDAKLLKCGVDSIRIYYPDLIPPRRQFLKDEDVRLALTGRSVKEAAVYLGVSTATLYQKKFRHLIPVPQGITEDMVRAALQGRTTIEAAAVLGVCHQTLRYGFDHLLHKRATPHHRLDPETIRIVLEAAKNPLISVRKLAAEHSISSQLAAQICADHKVTWMRNLARKGVSGRPKTAIRQQSV
jgi:hypothetical protein